MGTIATIECGCQMDSETGETTYACQECRRRWKKQETSERDSVLQVGTSDGLKSLGLAKELAEIGIESCRLAGNTRMVERLEGEITGLEKAAQIIYKVAL